MWDFSKLYGGSFAREIRRRLGSGVGVYVASKTRHADVWKTYRERGLPIVSTWIDEAGAGMTGSVSDLWERCVAECRGAAALVAYAAEEDAGSLEGVLVEVGVALCAGVPVFFHGPISRGRFPFTRHPLVTECSSLDEAVQSAALAAEHARVEADPVVVGDPEDPR
jgi:hypothetical protein